MISKYSDGIRVVGSSIIYWAQKYGQQNINDNLGLNNITETDLARNRGYGLVSVVPDNLGNAKAGNGHPRLLVIHCGGNDIGNPHDTLRGLRKYMKLTVSKTTKLLPKTIIVWSHILPR